MKLRKKILSTTLASAMLLSSVSVSLADELDIKNKNTGVVSSFYDVLDNQDLLFGIMDNKANYLIEVDGKLYNVSEVDAATKNGTSIGEAVKGLTPVADAEEKLEVESISAINQTTIKVTFNGKVTEAAAAKSNFTVSKGKLEAAQKISDTEVTLSVAGLTFDQTLTVTVGNPAYTKEVKVPAINELYTLVVTSDAESNTIKSDGAAMTMLTAKIVEKTTNQVVKNDAQIQFNTTLGSLSQPQVALVNGEASTQLRSTASPTSVTSVITAVVASAPGAEQYVGLTGQLIVNFTPDGVVDEELKMVTAVKAGANQGDRFFVEFSGDIKAEDYKKVVTSDKWGGKEYGVEYVNKLGVSSEIAIKDVYNIAPNKLMFVLDTDDNGTATNPELASIKPTATATERIDEKYAVFVAGQKNFLRDNVNHTIKFTNNVTGLVVNSPDITFMMSDVTKPFVYGVDAKDNMNLEVRLSEAMAEDLVEVKADKTKNDNFSIDGKDIIVNTAPTAAEILAAKQADKIIVTELRVGDYKTKDKDKDTRDMIYIKIHKDFKLSAGNHGIQIANIGDWAGMVDKPENLVTTQTFPFTVVADTQVPQATVVSQSPEQWLISFDKKVETVSGNNIEKAIKLYTAEGYKEDSKTALEMNEKIDAKDYVITPVDADGMVVTGVGNTGIGGRYKASDTINGHDKFLVEFNRDWSVKQKGQSNTKDNYWKSELNPFKVVLNNLESQTGVKMSESIKDLTLNYDGTSPEIAEAQDLFVKNPGMKFRSILKDDNNRSGKYVFVKMDEPVQLVDATGAAVSSPVTPNLEQDSSITNTYLNTKGVARPTYRFVKGDDVVIGDVRDLAEDDQSFVIEPKSPLTAGTWTLYIEQISDDHGNTSATISRQVVVPESKVESDTKVAWIGFDDDATDYDFLYIKFTKEMQAYTANGVDATTNYKFRGYDLPQGSQVFRGIEGNTDNWDGVTIRMPKSSWNGINDEKADYTTNVTVASNFKSADGKELSGPFQVELSHNKVKIEKDKNGVGFTEVVAGEFIGLITPNAEKLEALYINKEGESALVGGVPVLYVEASNPSKDGKYEEFKVQLAEPSTKLIKADAGPVTGDRFYIGGKAFKVASDVLVGSKSVTLVTATTSDTISSADLAEAGRVKLTNKAGNIAAGKINVLPVEINTQEEWDALYNTLKKNKDDQGVFTGKLLIKATENINIDKLEVNGTLYLDDNGGAHTITLTNGTTPSIVPVTLP